MTVLAVAVSPMLLWASGVLAQPVPVSSEGEAGPILYVPLPPDLSKAAVRPEEGSVKDRLRALADRSLVALEKKSPEDEETTDRIVIFTDAAGRPILPDLEAAQSRQSISGPSGYAVATANELSFTFDSPSFPWTAEQVADLTTILNDCYPLTKTIYGDPAFNITVNVRKHPNITGSYNSGINEITINGAFFLQPDVLCHEVIHAFRDDNIITHSSYEEGMTRAAEVEVFNQLPTYLHWDENHGYTYDVYYEGLNKPKIGSFQGGAFAGYVSALLRYQLAGYAWAKALLENPTFLVDFNREFYARMLSDSTTRTSEPKLLEIAVAVQPAVENKPFSTWYAQQGVFNTAPPEGYLLYQRINQYTVDYFHRNGSTITMQPGASIDWAIYDHNNLLLDSGSDVTDASGSFSIRYPTGPLLPPGYTGRITVVVKATSPDGPVIDATQRPAGVDSFPSGQAGVFGIVRNANTGTLALTPLDDPAASVTVNVVDGAFSAPSLAPVRGRFLAVFTHPLGQKFGKRFNKDASDYFVSVPGG
ncbi:MAG: hypothetical protein L0Y32_03915 [Nevskiales bacterium]|nr:hypothetical protein [Nevskiales bacterium]